MGRLNINIILPDDLEKKLRNESSKKYGLQRGNLTKAIKESIELWLTLREEVVNTAKYIAELEDYELRRIDFDTTLTNEEKEVAKKEFHRRFHVELPRLLFNTIQKTIEDVKQGRIS